MSHTITNMLSRWICPSTYDEWVGNFIESQFNCLPSNEFQFPLHGRHTQIYDQFS